MANGVFNIAKGRAKEYYDRVVQQDPAGCELKVALFEGTITDAVLEDLDTLALIVSSALTEASFTGYARKTVDDASSPAIASTPAPDDTANDNSYTLPDLTWTSAGSGNTLTRLVVCYSPAAASADSAIIPLTYHDFSISTNGGDLTADFPATELFTAS